MSAPTLERSTSRQRAVRIGRPLVADRDRTLRVHPDKATSQRATLLAAVADGDSVLRNLSSCADMRHNLRALSRLGRPVAAGSSGACVVSGCDVRELAYSGPPLDCCNSATTARILVALLAGSRASCTITGNGALRRRPMWWIIEPLRRMGAALEYAWDDGVLPVTVEGRRLSGATHSLPVDSAQPVSALAFAALAAAGPVVVRRRTRARDHTERLLRWAGVRVEEDGLTVYIEPCRPRAFELDVPGDPSAAAFVAALHLASPAAERWLRIDDVCLNPSRLGFFRVLAEMGADVELRPSGARGPEEVGTLAVRRNGPLRGAVVGGSELVQSAIDELPLVAALATAAEGTTTVRDAGELRDKDTDRIAGTAAVLSAFGGRVRPTGDGFAVIPAPLRRPSRPLALPRDHRLVFAASTLALLAGGDVTLAGIGAAATSNPGLLEDLAQFAEVETW